MGARVALGSFSQSSQRFRGEITPVLVMCCFLQNDNWLHLVQETNLWGEGHTDPAGLTLRGHLWWGWRPAHQPCRAALPSEHGGRGSMGGSVERDGLPEGALEVGGLPLAFAWASIVFSLCLKGGPRQYLFPVICLDNPYMLSRLQTFPTYLGMPKDGGDHCVSPGNVWRWSWQPRLRQHPMIFAFYTWAVVDTFDLWLCTLSTLVQQPDLTSLAPECTAPPRPQSIRHQPQLSPCFPACLPPGFQKGKLDPETQQLKSF